MGRLQPDKYQFELYLYRKIRLKKGYDHLKVMTKPQSPTYRRVMFRKRRFYSTGRALFLTIHASIIHWRLSRAFDISKPPKMMAIMI